MIETRVSPPYLGVVPPMHLVRFLTLLALLFAPIGMIDGHSAMAMPGTMAVTDPTGFSGSQAAHCAETSRESQDVPDSSSDCMKDCAVACSAIPALGSDMAEVAPITLLQPVPLARRIAGLHPESDPPPPRLA